MSDIAKCQDIHCPSKVYCYRFTAENGMWQYFHNFNREDDADNCDMFVSNRKCRYCHQDNGIHKMSCASQKITIIL